jgi:uncharacterized membrane protein
MSNLVAIACPDGERAAVVVLLRRSTPDKVVPRISQFGGEVVQTSLGPEREAELQEALGGQAAAV